MSIGDGKATVCVPNECSKKPEEVEKERGQWGTKAEFILTVMGAIIGPGNVWRFPYLCYRNGGVHQPGRDHMLEKDLSSFSRHWLCQSPDHHFQCNLLYYDPCVGILLPLLILQVRFALGHMWERLEHRRRVLNISGGIDEVGSLRWELVLCLLLSWVICYFCIWKGIKSTGKAAYFTATFPFLMLLVLLIRGVTLPGAVDGIIYYLSPDISRLSDPQVWMDAGTQIFFSYAIGLGFLTSLGSYNTYNNNCYKDCFYLCLLNSATSIVAGFAIFSVLGFMKNEQGVDISEVAESGPGLAFIVYPRAVAMMPMPQVWSVCFFFMIILLGLDSQFVGVECLMTSLVDHFPSYLHKGYRRELLLLVICCACCLLGLSLVTEGGMYLLQLLDHHVCSGTTLLLLSFCQSVSIGWVYGADRFHDNITDMIGYSPYPFMKYCWRYITPLVCFGTFIFSIVRYSPLMFSNTYVYPLWANILGWFIATVSLSLIPLFVLLKILQGEGTLRQRFLLLCQPVADLNQRRAPSAQETSELKPLN
ncbi:sodium- and chloride-dependent betaine transporter isoform X4 [Kryptolebias marmoratus]|uniref:sodium- and chloride-dependent betaine transporter isoform X4 n=1 Tax=Kryptolebias marmoratus TaxID=37003 RepID=UPI0007F8AC00|nr:sodium- and chloride-dependent betaine transporter isoform X4 [Kryptolebias marmoratus]